MHENMCHVQSNVKSNTQWVAIGKKDFKFVIIIQNLNAREAN